MRMYRDRKGSDLQVRDLVFYPGEAVGEFSLVMLLTSFGKGGAYAIPVHALKGDPLRNPVMDREACETMQWVTLDPAQVYSTYRAGDGSKIIGLTGLKGSGKTLVTNFFLKEKGYHNAVLAGPLKYAVEPILEACGFEPPHEWDSEPFKLKTLKLPAVTHDSVYHAFARMAQVSDSAGNPLPDAEDLAMPCFGTKRFKWALHHWTRYYQDNLAEREVTIRHVLQQFGTDMGRALTHTIWTQAVLPDLEHPLVVVDGVRFVDEANFLRDRNGRIYGVKRDRGSYQEDPHPSEREMRERWDEIVDETIDNHYMSIHDLYAHLRTRNF